jgi:hypothetical protein
MYAYQVLPMGPTNAPAVFQAAMKNVFGRHSTEFVCVNFDNILITSNSAAEHVGHLEEV